MTVPAFISYHGADIAIARALRTSLLRLSPDFDAFLDRDCIGPSDNYKEVIAKKIKEAEWFLIICTGFPRSDADMMWSFFEAGQFRATLKPSLIKDSNKRIVCFFDEEPPAIFSEFHGVKVRAQQRGGGPIDMPLPPAQNTQLDDSAIYDLLQRMLKNDPDASLRDVSAASTKEMLREESHKLIRYFEAARPGDVIEEKSLQPRISFELLAGESLSSKTAVKGYEASLRHLFSIESETTTWADIVQCCSTSNGGKPAWLSDIELAATDIMKDRTPANAANKCLLENVIYRVYSARYEVYKDRRRVIYVVFLPVTRQPFDLRKRSSTLLSSLILSVRFREQLIPMVEQLRNEPTAALVQDFYRLLLAIEMEARQFGLVVDTAIPDDESPLAAAFTDGKKREIIQQRIQEWAPDRALIEKMFVDEPVNLEAPGEAARCAAIIAGILENTAKVNAEFIEMIAEELLAQIKEGEKKRPKVRPRIDKAPPSRKPAGKPARRAAGVH
jgi:hypothetical protein